MCNSKKSKFIKEQETIRFLSSWGIKNSTQGFSAGDKFMPEMHAKQPGFTYSAYRLFTKNKKIIQKFKKNRRFTTYLSKRTG